jgi:hypothetical protein
MPFKLHEKLPKQKLARQCHTPDGVDMVCIFLARLKPFQNLKDFVQGIEFKYDMLVLGRGSSCFLQLFRYLSYQFFGKSS